MFVSGRRGRRPAFVASIHVADWPLGLVWMTSLSSKLNFDPNSALAPYLVGTSTAVPSENTSNQAFS